MNRSKRLALAASACVAGLAGFGGNAVAAFPNFSDCPLSNPTLNACIDIQSRTGSMTIKGFTVPLGESLEIRGGVALGATPNDTQFIPPVGKTGFFGRPIQIPGGILGINFPLPGNAVTATATLAGPPSSIKLNLVTYDISVPIFLKLTNPIIGPGCQIGTTSNPSRLNMRTTRPGRETFTDTYTLVTGNTNADNTFAVPGATGCGIGLGLINSLINVKLRLPSSSGNNQTVLTSDAAVGS